MEIWDIHCHLPSNRVPGRNLDEQMANMIEIGRRVGIDKFGLFLRTERDRGPSNDEIRRAVEKHHPHVLGFVWVNLPEVQQSIDKINRWIGDGPFVGLKLGGGSGICSKPAHDPVFVRAVELGTIIYQHTWIKLGGDPLRPGGGNLPKESAPDDLLELAGRYPEHPFICGHTGGDWELGIRTVRPAKNVPVEIAGGYPSAGMVEMAVRELGAERVIFGSDVTGRSFASQLGKVHGARITDAQRRMIFSENIRRYGEPILKAKGFL